MSSCFMFMPLLVPLFSVQHFGQPWLYMCFINNKYKCKFKILVIKQLLCYFIFVMFYVNLFIYFFLTTLKFANMFVFVVFYYYLIIIYHLIYWVQNLYQLTTLNIIHKCEQLYWLIVCFSFGCFKCVELLLIFKIADKNLCLYNYSSFLFFYNWFPSHLFSLFKLE